MEKLKNKIEARIKALKILSIEPELGSFVIQQNDIQNLLTYLVIQRGKNYNLIDKKWIEELEKSTLGKVIKFYQLSANKVSEEIKLIGKLKRYNKIRNSLIHNKMELNDYQLNEDILKESKKLGTEILEILNKLITEELKELIKNKKVKKVSNLLFLKEYL